MYPMNNLACKGLRMISADNSAYKVLREINSYSFIHLMTQQIFELQSNLIELLLSYSLSEN